MLHRQATHEAIGSWGTPNRRGRDTAMVHTEADGSSEAGQVTAEPVAVWINRHHAVWPTSVVKAELVGDYDHVYWLAVTETSGNRYDTELSTTHDPEGPGTVDAVVGRLRAQDVDVVDLRNSDDA